MSPEINRSDWPRGRWLEDRIVSDFEGRIEPLHPEGEDTVEIPSLPALDGPTAGWFRGIFERLEHEIDEPS